MIKHYFKTLDYKLLAAIAFLCGIGAVMVYSASSVTAITRFNMAGNALFLSQLTAMAGGGVLFLVFSIIPYRILQKRLFYVLNVLISMGLLAFTLFFGEEVNGARAWLNLGGFQFQPAEFVKIAVIVVLAYRYTLRQGIIHKFWEGVFPPLVYVLILFLIIFAQNDLGTGLTLLGISAFTLLGVGMPMKSLVRVSVLGSSIAALAGWFAYHFLLGPHHLTRFATMTDPFSVSRGAGFQPINAFMAMTNGGFFGLGLGNSIQKFDRLPEAHTDFIMAIVAEELGFIGVAAILLGLAFIAYRGLVIAKRCPDTFGSLLAVGVSSYIVVQTFVNIGGITGLIPMTGVPLPFISFGGSSIAATLFGMGILMSVSRYNNALALAKEKNERQGQKHEERPKLTVIK